MTACDQDIPGIIRRSLDQKSGKPFIVFGGRCITYGELRRKVLRYTSYFERAGIRAGDRVVFSSKDEAFVCCLYLSLLANGVTSVFLDPDSGSERANAIINHCQPRSIFADGDLLDKWHLSPAPSLNIVPVVRDDGNGIVTALSRPRGRRGESFPEGMETAKEAEPAQRIDARSDAYVLFTSGTTSAPKGVRISYQALFAHLSTLTNVYQLDSQSKILNNLILSHVDGMVQGPLLTLFSLSTLYRPFPFAIQRIDDTFDLLYREQITHWVLVPTMLALMVRFKQDDGDTLDSGKFKYIVSCGDKLESELWRNVENKWKTRIINGYGLTETVTGGLFAGPGEASHVIGTIGVPVDCEAKIVDGTGKETPPGETGEILMRGPLLMSGYLNDPEATREAFSDGWLKTGDMGYLGTDGCFRTVGRKKSIIISGGVNVSPDEVSEVLQTHPGIREAVAFGLPDPIWGEIIACAVAGGAPDVLREEEIIDYCRRHLEERKVPSKVFILDALPRGRSGKVMIPGLLERIKIRHPAVPLYSGNLPAFLEIASKSLQLPLERVDLRMTTDDTPAWDSLSHLTLIVGLENRFHVAFTPLEVMNCRRLSNLYETVEKKMNDPASRSDVSQRTETFGAASGGPDGLWPVPPQAGLKA
jgi:long-chain acyl-CoA synthetase